MFTAALSIIVVASLALAVVAVTSLNRFQKATAKHDAEMLQREKELKRHLLELQVLRSLSERVGYSLDLRQILDIIIDSLSGLVEFSTVSYLMEGTEGRMVLKVHTAESVSHKYLEMAKQQVLEAFSAEAGHQVEGGLVDETVSGVSLDDNATILVSSSFNLPISISNQIVALINISSTKPKLYGEGDMAVLHNIMSQVSASATKLTQVVENEKRKLTSMITSLSDGVLMVDPHYNVLVTNLALNRLLNLQDGESNLFDVVAAVGTKADIQGAIAQSLSSQQLVKLSEFSLGDYALRVDVSPVKDKFGYLLGATVLFHDVTEEKRLERLREDFTAMMVHELRTPLTTISYSTDAMLSDMSKMTTEQLTKDIEVIDNTTQEMLSLVSELLDVAKIEAGKFQIVQKEDSLVSLINEKIEAFKALAEEKNLHLVAEIDSALKDLSFDRRRLGQVLDNLLSNSFKYTTQGQVAIRTKVDEPNRRVLVAISDTGEGIKAEDLPKLFSKFEQLGKGKSGEKGGTGLGLVVTKGIIEAHGGHIWVTSPGAGQGTTFTFSLPLG